MRRKPGFYWIKMIKGARWEVAEYRGNGEWNTFDDFASRMITVYTPHYNTENFYKIGKRIPQKP